MLPVLKRSVLIFGITFLFLFVQLGAGLVLNDPAFTSMAFAQKKGKDKDKKEKDDDKNELKGNKRLRAAVSDLQSVAQSLQTQINEIQLIPGPPGADGKDGAQGPQGVAGKDGVDGTNGTNGIDGINGTNGIDGTNGTNGKDGVDGRDGADSTVAGPPGPQGVDGFQGPQGEPGPPGPSGVSGFYTAERTAAGFLTLNIGMSHIPGMAITFTLDKTSKVYMQSRVTIRSQGHEPFHAGFDFEINGVRQGEPTWGLGIVMDPAGTWWNTTSIDHTVVLGPGTHHIQFTGNQTLANSGIYIGGEWGGATPSYAYGRMNVWVMDN